MNRQRPATTAMACGLLAVTAGGCGGKAPPKAGGPAAATCPYRLKTAVDGAVTSTYTYDPLGRVAAVTKSQGATVLSTTTYAYVPPVGPPTSVVQTEVGSTAPPIVYPLDARGLATGNGTATYQYDADGFLTRTTIGGVVTDMRTVVNGNVTVETRAGPPPLTFTLTYTGLPNCIGARVTPFLGRATNDLPQTQSYSDGTPTTTYTYGVVIGRVTSRTVSPVAAGVTPTVTFTYEDATP